MGEKLGIGMVVAANSVSLAVADMVFGMSTLVTVKLPAFYVKTSGHWGMRPADITDLVSLLPTNIVTKGRALEPINAREVLDQAIRIGLGKAQNILGSSIDFICTVVPPSLPERDRARLRGLVRDIGVEILFFNEDQAVLQAESEFRRARSVLVFNVRGINTEISFYRSSGSALALERLEVMEGVGLDVLDLGLLEALVRNRGTSSPPTPDFPTLFQAVGSARKTWQQGSSLSLSDGTFTGFGKTALDSAQVEQILRSTFDSSISVARGMLDQDDSSRLGVLICPDSGNPYLVSSLQQALGSEIKTVGRSRALEGAVSRAREAVGMKPLQLTGLAIPVVIDLLQAISRGPERRDERSALIPSRPESLEDRKQDPVDPGADLRVCLEKILRAFKVQTSDQILMSLPKIESSLNEFLARVYDQLAKNLIEKNDFLGALEIYEKAWNTCTADYLRAPAVSLCLVQARGAIGASRIPAAKQWIRKGLKFDEHHVELVHLNRTLKSKWRR